MDLELVLEGVNTPVTSLVTWDKLLPKVFLLPSTPKAVQLTHAL